MRLPMTYFIMLLGLVLTTTLAAQTDPITLEKAAGSYRFYQAGERLKLGEVVDGMESNQLAYDQIKVARSNYNTAGVFSFIGGACIGWPLGTAIGGGDPEWWLAGIGAGLVVVSIPFTKKFKTNADAALDTFNTGFSQHQPKPDIRLTLAGNGLGLQWKF